MKKLLNKLNGSGKFDVDALREEEHLSGDEQFEDLHYRKSATLPSDSRDNAEDIKPVRKSSLTKKVISPRAKGIAAMETDERKSSKELHKDKLNDSDDKVIRKSFSLKNVTLFNKSTDQVKNTDSPIRSPSLKSIFSSYEQQRDSLVDVEGSDEEMNDDAAVPHNRVLGTRDDEDLYFTAPIRVPSAPARIATSPLASPSGSRSPMSSSPVAARNSSPRMINSPPGSPQFTQHSPSPRVPTFSPTPTAPPPQAIKPAPMVLVADDFDAHFASLGSRANRSESITDDYGAPYRGYDSRDRADSVDEEVDLDNELMHDKPKSGGLFSSFGTNKPKKLK